VSKLEMGKTYRSLFAGNTGHRFTPIFVGKQVSILSRSDSGTEQIYDHDSNWLVEYVSPPPPPRTGVKWLHIWLGSDGETMYSASFGKRPTKSEYTIAIVKVEWVEGQFDE